MASVLLLFPNHPAYYPHVARHAQALSEKFSQVHVGAVFAANDPLPALPNVAFYSLSPEFPKGILGFALFMLRANLLVKHLKPDAVEAVDPPCLVPASMAKKKQNFHLVYFSMELFTETPALAKKPLRRRIWGLLERRAVRLAEQILTVNASVAQQLRTRFAGAAVGVVRSMPYRSKLPPKDAWMRKQFTIPAHNLILVYQGHLEAGRGLEKVCEAVLHRPTLHLVILGLGPLATWCQERAVQQANVHFGGAFPFDELMIKASGADAGLVWIEPVSESYRISLPGKIFEYAQNGLPILGSPLPEISKHIISGDVGVIAEDFSQGAMLVALDLLCNGIRQQKFQNGLVRAREEWCWEHEQMHLRRAF